MPVVEPAHRPEHGFFVGVGLVGPDSLNPRFHTHPGSSSQTQRVPLTETNWFASLGRMLGIWTPFSCLVLHRQNSRPWYPSVQSCCVCGRGAYGHVDSSAVENLQWPDRIQNIGNDEDSFHRNAFHVLHVHGGKGKHSTRIGVLGSPHAYTDKASDANPDICYVD
jgi:hypothetical protein